jgi:two-component system, cell cycle response regulator
MRKDRAYVTIIAGSHVGEMYPIAGGLVVGRGGDVDIRIVDDDISRRHARIGIQGRDVFVEDLGSKNGTQLNGVSIRRESLRDGDKIQVGGSTVLRFSMQDALDESFQRQMYESALRDPLTRVYNRKYLMDRMASEIAYAARHTAPLSLLLIDIDFFKTINDTYGHLAGDAVLVGLSKHVLRVIRTEDVFARYGGEEFAILSRGISVAGAAKFGGRLRAAIETYPFSFEGQRIQITVSLGVAGMPECPVSDAPSLLGFADQALYAAKNGGRNRVEIYEPSQP